MLTRDRMVEEREAMAERLREAEETNPDLYERIVDAAIDIAEDEGRTDVRLADVANVLGVTRVDVAGQHRDLDAVANACFGRARLMLRWFDAPALHGEVTAQMLAVKMWPFHPHHWVPKIFELSRSILWLRDAAGLHARPPRRQVEETALSGLFLATLAVWTQDATVDQERIRRFLQNRLRAGDRVMARVLTGL